MFFSAVGRTTMLMNDKYISYLSENFNEASLKLT